MQRRSSNWVNLNHK